MNKKRYWKKHRQQFNGIGMNCDYCGFPTVEWLIVDKQPRKNCIKITTLMCKDCFMKEEEE